MKRKPILFALLFAAYTMSVYAGTTGKIFGKITNLNSGDPMPKVSVNIMGTNLGAATDYEGDYFVINVPPGEYTLKAGGIGLQQANIEGIKVAADESTKINFEMRYTDGFVFTEKWDEGFLELFTEDQRVELLKLKEENKIEYSKQLLKKYYSPPEISENQEAFMYQNILQHSKQIDKLGEEYKRQDNDEEKKKIQRDMMKLLEERFTLQEKKMQFEIQKLSEGIENLQKELQRFREDKETIIQREYETYVD
jgi:hypothetical protein